jgi:ribosome-associated protein
MCAEFAANAKAENILLLDMRKLTSVVDFFVIATVPSRRQAVGIAGQIETEMKKRQEKKLSVETSETGRWTLLDYGDVVIHLFSPDGRDFYSLDEVWGDAPRLDWTRPEQELPQ